MKKDYNCHCKENNYMSEYETVFLKMLRGRISRAVYSTILYLICRSLLGCYPIFGPDISPNCYSNLLLCKLPILSPSLPPPHCGLETSLKCKLMMVQDGI